MKKRLLKGVSMLLSLVILFSVFGAGLPATVASADEGDGETVAVLYLCVCGIRLPYIFGHTWMVVENVSGEPLTVGSKTLEPGAMLSAGLHSGVGMEFDREMREFRGQSVTAIAREMTADELERAAKEIVNSRWDHYNLFVHNCTHFCSAVWKAATGVNFGVSVIPAILKSKMPASQRISLRIP
ncbi:MAG: hypothetical protein IJJ85_03765 [Clostridia bacterium]|nr:hypothetical protein [Clostridia bacterium]